MKFDREKIVQGSLLGDAAICKSFDKRQNTYNYYYAESHSNKQKDYLLWKSSFFQNPSFGERKRKSKLNGRTISSTEFRMHVYSNHMWKPIRDDWYIKNVKEVPGDIELSPESIAIWYMDDGTFHVFSGVIELYTNGFNLQSQHILQKELRKFNINAQIKSVKSISGKEAVKRYILYIPRKESWKLLDLVKKGIHKDLEYKLPIDYSNFKNMRNRKSKTISYATEENKAKNMIIDNLKEFNSQYSYNEGFPIVKYLFWENGYSHKPIQRLFGSMKAALEQANLCTNFI